MGVRGNVESPALIMMEERRPVKAIEPPAHVALSALIDHDGIAAADSFGAAWKSVGPVNAAPHHCGTISDNCVPQRNFVGLEVCWDKGRNVLWFQSRLGVREGRKRKEKKKSCP